MARSSSFNEEAAQTADDEENLDDDTQPGTALYDFSAGGDDEVNRLKLLSQLLHHFEDNRLILLIHPNTDQSYRWRGAGNRI